MMLQDRIFRVALLISIIFHAVIFYKWPAMIHWRVLDTHDKIEVTYSPPGKAKIMPQAEAISDKENIRMKNQATPVYKRDSVSQVKGQAGAGKAGGYMLQKRQGLSLPEKPQFNRLEIGQKTIAAESKDDNKMLISHQERDFSDEPIYMNYYNALRSKIYKIANENKPRYFNEGAVRLLFTISRDGSLTNISVMSQSPGVDQALRDYSIMSIKTAAPFAPFSASMKESELTMRLTISFEK